MRPTARRAGKQEGPAALHGELRSFCSNLYGKNVSVCVCVCVYTYIYIFSSIIYKSLNYTPETNTPLRTNHTLIKNKDSF